MQYPLNDIQNGKITTKEVIEPSNTKLFVLKIITYMKHIPEVKFTNFYKKTKGLWSPCDLPNTTPDFVSSSNSKYWFAGDVRENTLKRLMLTEDYLLWGIELSGYSQQKRSSLKVIRYSNHWVKVGKCRWGLSGRYLPTTFKDWVCAEIYLKDLHFITPHVGSNRKKKRHGGRM